MPDRTRLAAVLGVGAYNLVQNLMIPSAAYVPANLAAAIGLVALARRYGCSWEDLGLQPSRASSGVRWGLAGVGAAVIVATAGSVRPPTGRYFLDERALGHDRRERVYRAAIRFPLGTALFEEMVFRGVVYGVWRRSGATPGGAAAAAAATFGVWHLIPAGQALTGNPLGSRFGSGRSRHGLVIAGVVFTALSSFGFSWLRERSGSLIAPWLTHAAINSAGYLAGVAAWERLSLAKR